MLSLVSVCMNREQHLRRTLPAWLALPGVDEIVLVDWSTREPFDDLLALDPRIRIIRVVDEPRWILSYAFNLGIQHARGDLILKCDADCLPSPEILKLRPTADVFYAGNWRQGRPQGKACVNGQCFFTRAQFEAVNGYSEVIRIYGRDDEDFYDRMIAKGFARRDLPVAELSFVEHTQEARVANQIATVADPIEAFLQQQTPFHEMTNLVIAQFLPWGTWFHRASYHTLESHSRLTCVRRDLAREIPITEAVRQQANHHGLVAVVTQLFSLPATEVARLDRPRCLQLLKQHLATRRSPTLAA